MKEMNKNIAMNIRNYLEIFGISQLELAQKLNCSNSTVSMWVKGNATPRLEKIDQMCEIFGCERSDIVSDTPKSATEVKQAWRVRAFIKRFQAMQAEDQLDLLAYMEDNYGEEKEGDL